ncbi:MAG: pyridoxamine 5'-phosphate oxidase family protein [Anaerolineales bacterium]|nr:pyridoxamine 5'-phosphate oxidase family protein [Anaerolineales bacterium]
MQAKDQNPFNPQASRPDMPEYGLLNADQGQGLLPWSWAEERLERSHNYWVSTTRPDGRPHATAVWGVWWDNAFYFSSGRLTRKARNLAQNANCVICTESAAQAVIVEGVAQLVGNGETLGMLGQVYRAKYDSDYPSESNIYIVHPKVVFGFIEAETEFSGSATRWIIMSK